LLDFLRFFTLPLHDVRIRPDTNGHERTLLSYHPNYTSAMQHLPITPYRHAVRYLREHPQELPNVWYYGMHHPSGAGILFRCLSPDGEPYPLNEERTLFAGNPLQIKWSHTTTSTSVPWRYGAWTEDLEQTILSSALPSHPRRLTDADLVWLAFFQRRVDETLRYPEWRRAYADLLRAPWPPFPDPLGDVGTASGEVSNSETGDWS
jgi:hypothetical protein